MANDLYNRIAVLRAERNLSRQDLADALAINPQTIGFLERGDYNPSLSLALALSEFFQLPVEAIFSRRPFRPLSEQVYRATVTEKANPVGLGTSGKHARMDGKGAKR